MDNAEFANEINQRRIGSRPTAEAGVVTGVPALGRVQVNCSGLAESVLCVAHLASLVVGDKVLICRGGGLSWVHGLLTVPDLPTAPNPPAPPPTVPLVGSTAFLASDSATWRNTAWTQGDLSQGDGGAGVNAGAWFYAGQPHARLAGATISGCRISFTRKGGTVGAQVIHLFLHTSPTRPAADVARTLGPVDATVDVGQTVSVTLPASWGQAMVDTGCGIGIFGGTHAILAGVDKDPGSGLITLDWGF